MRLVKEQERGDQLKLEVASLKAHHAASVAALEKENAKLGHKVAQGQHLVKHAHARMRMHLIKRMHTPFVFV